MVEAMSENTSRPHLRKELSGEPGLMSDPKEGVEKGLPTMLSPPAPTLRNLKHHEMCPGIRGKECTCAANLAHLKEGAFTALEKKKVDWKEPGILDTPEGKRQGIVTVSAELWRLDDGRSEWVTRVNPNSPRQKPIEVEVKLPPRWLCTRCGFSMRGDDVSHRCDNAAVALATRVSSLADGLTPEEMESGVVRLVLWRDKDKYYHLAEELVRDGKVERMLERDKDITYGVIEGAMLAAAVDLWS